MAKIQKLTICKVCERKFILEPICEQCQNQDIHHERKVPQRSLPAMLRKRLKTYQNLKWKVLLPGLLRVK